MQFNKHLIYHYYKQTDLNHLKAITIKLTLIILYEFIFEAIIKAVFFILSHKSRLTLFYIRNLANEKFYCLTAICKIDYLF